ncbi:MAG: aminotransferase class I/II-fold pyridoxal phosphate-dependent enzyme, partial [Pseudomonadota bacterium]
MALFDELGPQAQSLPESKIVAVVNHARERDDVIKLWVGEGDLPTPDFICDAAVQSLRDGETFYTYQRGIPPLREALAAYHERHFGGPQDPETFFVTGSGMQAIKLAIEAVCTAGDEVVFLSPSWPNITAALTIFGVKPVPVLLECQPGGWTLDMERLAGAISPNTR